MNYRLQRLYALAGAPVVRLCEGRYGVTRREFRLLCLVVDGGPVLPSRLSELAHLDLARASRVIAALARKRLVRREVQDGDRRFALVAATCEGVALHQELFPQIARINQGVVSVLDAGQVKALDQILSVLTRHAEVMNSSIVLDVGADRQRGRRSPDDDMA